MQERMGILDPVCGIKLHSSMRNLQAFVATKRTLH